MYVLEEGLSEQFLGAKFMYDSYHYAIKLAKKEGIPDDDASLLEMMASKRKYGQDCTKMRAKIMKLMPSQDNLVKLDDNWYGVRYMANKSEVVLSIELLKEKDLFILQRDSNRMHDLTQIEIDTLLESVVNKELLELHKAAIVDYSRKLLDNAGISSEGDKLDGDSEDKLRVSLHSMQRWAMRKMGVTGERNIESYVRSNQVAIIQAIRDRFDGAKYIYTGLDGMEFWIDDDNIVYVFGKSGGPTIVTLYEVDFGWHKSFNRWLVENQIVLIQESEKVYNEAVQAHAKTIEDLCLQASQLDDEIAELEERITYLLAKKQSGISAVEESNSQIRAKKAAYDTQFNRIFRKWEG